MNQITANDLEIKLVASKCKMANMILRFPLIVIF